MGMVSNVYSAGSMAIANTKQNTRTTIVAALLERDLPDTQSCELHLLFYLITYFPLVGISTWIQIIYCEPTGESTGCDSIGILWLLVQSVSLRLQLILS